MNIATNWFLLYYNIKKMNIPTIKCQGSTNHESMCQESMCQASMCQASMCQGARHIKEVQLPEYTYIHPIIDV